jgi:type II secretory pathway predicted ATPase ExeA
MKMRSVFTKKARNVRHSNLAFNSANNFFATPELSQRLKLLQHLIQHSDQLLIVMADAGFGKTTFLKQLTAQIDENWKLIIPNSSPEITEEHLLTELAKSFGIRPEGKTHAILIENIRSHVASARYNQQLPVILMDDAHLLPFTTLRTLIELGVLGDPPTRIRVVLFCESQMSSLFAAPELAFIRNYLVHTIDIPRLSEKQAREYLTFLLNETNHQNEHPFNNLIIKKIYDESTGILGEFKQLAHQKLALHLAQHIPTHSEITSSRRFENWKQNARTLAIISLFIFLLAIAYWLKNRFFEMKDALPPEIPQELSLPQTSELTNKPNQEKTTLFKDSAWLVKQPAESYTLQVMGSHNIETLENLVKKYHLEGEMAIFTSRYREKTWFVLTFGVYQTSAEAQAALDKLPSNLRQTSKPWVRSLRSIQQSINAKS